MKRVGPKLEKIRGYSQGGGIVIRSAEGRGVSRSRESHQRGQELAQANIQRAQRAGGRRGLLKR